MSAPVAFLTLFLGLLSGKLPVALQAADSVKSIRVLLAGRTVATLHGPPWQAEIDLGSEIVPRRIEAIAYDGEGNELGRASEVLNLPRKNADIEIALQYEHGVPTGAEIRYAHIEFEKPTRASLTLDGKPLRLSPAYKAEFPETDWTHPHAIAAEMRFPYGLIARRELVAGGTVTDSAEAELSPIVLMQRARSARTDYGGCLSLNGAPVRTSPVENPVARVIFVRDPDPEDAVRAIDPARRATTPSTMLTMRSFVQLDEDTVQEILWPLSTRVTDPKTGQSSWLFQPTGTFPSRMGLMWILTVKSDQDDRSPRQFADAAAVATARVAGQRGAVVVVLGRRADGITRPPSTVRRYAVALGVPLFVWSVTGPRPELRSTWGEVEDISTIPLLRRAAARVRESVKAQRIAWVAADRFSALGVIADPRCGIATASQQP